MPLSTPTSPLPPLTITIPPLTLTSPLPLYFISNRLIPTTSSTSPSWSPALPLIYIPTSHPLFNLLNLFSSSLLSLLHTRHETSPVLLTYLVLPLLHHQHPTSQPLPYFPILIPCPSPTSSNLHLNFTSPIYPSLLIPTSHPSRNFPHTTPLPPLHITLPPSTLAYPLLLYCITNLLLSNPSFTSHTHQYFSILIPLLLSHSPTSTSRSPTSPPVQTYFTSSI